VSATALLRTNVLSYLAATGGGAGGGVGGGEALRVMVVLDFATYTVHPGGVSRAALAGLRALATGAKMPDGADVVKVAVLPSEWRAGRGGGGRRGALRERPCLRDCAGADGGSVGIQLLNWSPMDEEYTPPKGGGVLTALVSVMDCRCPCGALPRRARVCVLRAAGPVRSTRAGRHGRPEERGHGGAGCGV
jgi:hypothetical protein